MKQTHSYRFRGTFAFCLVATLLLLPFSGCNDGQSASARALHSCELFSLSEIEAIVGAKVDTPPRETHKVDEENNFWMSMCNYFAPEPGVSLGIMLQPLSPPDSPEKAHDSHVSSLKSSLPDYQVTPVEGIGRKAIWSGDTGQLTVFTNDHMVLITSMRMGAAGEEKLALAKTVALETLEKLQ